MPELHKITIVVRGGQVVSVDGLPPGWDYELIDYDNCPQCGGADPDCELCKQEASCRVQHSSVSV